MPVINDDKVLGNVEANVICILNLTSLLFEETPPSQPSSRDTSRRTTPRGSADSSRHGSRQTSSERPTVDAPQTAFNITTHMLKKSTPTMKPIERSASLQDVAGTSYASIAGISPREPAARDPRLRTRAQITPETARGPFDKAHRSPVKIPEAPKAFSRPPKRQQESDDEAKTPGRSTRQKIEVGGPLLSHAAHAGRRNSPALNPKPHIRLNRRNR
ncbi:hypothetical protein ACJJTC_000966 [Scirpophaga incertulas]